MAEQIGRFAIPVVGETPIIVVAPELQNIITKLNNSISTLLVLAQKQVPIGSSSRSLTISTDITEFKPDEPWIGFTLRNDGAAAVYMRVNLTTGNMLNEAPINTGETLTVDFTWPVIKKIYLVTSSGTAAIRLYAKIAAREE